MLKHLIRVDFVVIRLSVTFLKRMEILCVTIAGNLGYNEINSFVMLPCQRERRKGRNDK